MRPGVHPDRRAVGVGWRGRSVVRAGFASGPASVSAGGAVGEAWISVIRTTSSWDLHFADVGDRGALGHVERQKPERVLLAVGVHRPPDLVTAGAARREGR